ncbi:MAG: hypothetical protein VX213_05175, partial [Chloroflexota bacterium]|nr:hypothetical protein [Chloroflexota bacterium]
PRGYPCQLIQTCDNYSIFTREAYLASAKVHEVPIQHVLSRVLGFPSENVPAVSGLGNFV